MFAKTIQIRNKKIGDNQPVFIIAEAGVNHNGDIQLAKKMIDEAVEAKVDAVKFQSFKTDKLILQDIQKAPYQKNTTDQNESQYEMLQHLQLSIDNMKELKEYCENKHIIFLSTPFDDESLSELKNIGVDAIKIASTDTTNVSFLRKAAKTGKPLLLSTGMCSIEEIDKAVETIGKCNDQLVLLQCTANYPIKDSEANLNVITLYQNRYHVITGYSDHSEGVGAAPYSIPLGAKVIEKHFTLDKNMQGPDHKASLNPKELQELVKQIRKVEQYMGAKEVKEPTKDELETKKSLQKYLVAAKDIQKGELFTENNITYKRTGGIGISAIHFDSLLNKTASKTYLYNEVLSEEEL